MYEVMCRCDWIPGVEHGAFPSHLHRVRQVFRDTRTGRLVETCFVASGMIQPDLIWETVEEEEVVLLHVDWKALARMKAQEES